MSERKKNGKAADILWIKKEASEKRESPSFCTHRSAQDWPDVEGKNGTGVINKRDERTNLEAKRKRVVNLTLGKYGPKRLVQEKKGGELKPPNRTPKNSGGASIYSFLGD